MTIHPDIQKPGLLHIPVRTTEPLQGTAEENVDYIRTTAKRQMPYSVLTYSAIFLTCLAAGTPGGALVTATTLLAFALVVDSDKE